MQSWTLAAVSDLVIASRSKVRSAPPCVLNTRVVVIVPSFVWRFQRNAPWWIADVFQMQMQDTE